MATRTDRYKVFNADGNVVIDVPITVDTAVDNSPAGVLARAQTAYSNNLDYLAINSPTNAQVAAQVAALTRQMNGVIRLLSNLDKLSILPTATVVGG